MSTDGAKGSAPVAHHPDAAPCHLSVITPVLNGVRFIEHCIQSVAAQNGSAIEHVIVDGGSTDGTIKVIEAMAARYPHVRWVSSPGTGQSEGMNQGVALAQGRVIGVLNVDDFYEPGTLNRVIEIFRDLPEPALAVGNCNVLDDSGELSGVNRPRNPYLIDMLVRDPGGPNVPVKPSAYFYHRSLHEWIGPYDIAEHVVLDVDFLLRAVQVAHVIYVNETWGNFWLHSESKTARDIRAETAGARFNAIIRRYRTRLSARDRIVVELKSLASAPRLITARLRKMSGALPIVAHLRKMLRVLPR
jgi:glycosyltransferase involved in cell wall biosynthesis